MAIILVVPLDSYLVVKVHILPDLKLLKNCLTRLDISNMSNQQFYLASFPYFILSVSFIRFHLSAPPLRLIM